MGESRLMDLTVPPLIWAQAQAPRVGANPDSMVLLALRRWCSSLTLSSPEVVPDLNGLWAGLLGLAALFVIAVLFQGPTRALKQVLDLPGHLRLVTSATNRVWSSARLVSIAMGFTVLSWTASQALVFNRDSGKADLLMLTRSRGLGELSIEHGILAGLTPLRDVAGLGDNLALLVCAVIVLFRVSFEPPGSFMATGRTRARSNVSTVIWCGASFYALYRIVVRGAGNLDLPLGGCLVIEALVIPILMLISDGFLLAWLLAELRNAGLDATGEDRLDPLQAAELMPAAALACLVALPARYMATFVWLARLNLPASVNSTPLGRYIRWQLGSGLTDLQAAALVVVGLVGVVAWSRGTIGGSIGGYRRLLTVEAGHLIGTLAMAGVAAAMLAAPAYAVVLLLPAQTWVLAAADSYAHFATLPVGLWTLAALIELAERSLPTAARAEARTAGRAPSQNRPAVEHAIGDASNSPVVAPS